jgi:hypothetical protein
VLTDKLEDGGAFTTGDYQTAQSLYLRSPAYFDRLNGWYPFQHMDMLNESPLESQYADFHIQSLSPVVTGLPFWLN